MGIALGTGANGGLQFVYANDALPAIKFVIDEVKLRHIENVPLIELVETNNGMVVVMPLYAEDADMLAGLRVKEDERWVISFDDWNIRSTNEFVAGIECPKSSTGVDWQCWDLECQTCNGRRHRKSVFGFINRRKFR